MKVKYNINQNFQYPILQRKYWRKFTLRLNSSPLKILEKSWDQIQPIVMLKFWRSVNLRQEILYKIWTWLKKKPSYGSAKYSGRVRASRPANPGSNLNVSKVFFRPMMSLSLIDSALLWAKRAVQSWSKAFSAGESSPAKSLLRNLLRKLDAPRALFPLLLSRSKT